MTSGARAKIVIKKIFFCNKVKFKNFKRKEDIKNLKEQLNEHSIFKRFS